MNQLVLDTAVELMVQDGKVTELGPDTRAGVYEFIEKGKHPAGFMQSLAGQLRFELVLTDKQLLTAANIMKGRFKDYLKKHNMEVKLNEQGDAILVEPPPVQAPEPVAEKPAPRRRKRKAAAAA